MYSLPVRRMPKHWPFLDDRDGCAWPDKVSSPLIFHPTIGADAAACGWPDHTQCVGHRCGRPLFSRLGAPMYAHERTTLSIVAESIARLNGHGYLGVFDAKQHSTERVFF